MTITGRTPTTAESASSQSVSPALPSDRVTGDIVVFWASVPGTNPGTELTAPSGWTQAFAPFAVNDNNIVGCWYRFDPPGAPTATTSAAANRTSGICLAYGGVNSTTPLDVTPNTAVSNPGTSINLSLTTVTDGCELVSGAILDSSTADFTAIPSGMSVIASTTTGGTGRGSAVADQAQATHGASGTKTWTIASSLGIGGFLLALRPGNVLIVTGSVTATGVLTPKTTTKKLTGSSTPTGAATFLKVVVKAFTASVTATGALFKKINKNPTGTVSTTGVFVKVPHKTFTASSTPTGTFRKAFVRVFTSTVATTGAFSITFLGRVFGRPGRAVVQAFRAAEAFIRVRRT